MARDMGLVEEAVAVLGAVCNVVSQREVQPGAVGVPLRMMGSGGSVVVIPIILILIPLIPKK